MNEPDRDSITYGFGLEPFERAAAAAIYCDAFGRELGPILGARGEAFLAGNLNLDRAVAARSGQRLVGLAGVEFEKKALLTFPWGELCHTYGWMSGSLRLLVLAIFDRSARPGELLMDGIAVTPDCRGQGIGSELLRLVCDRGRALGLTRVRLDVVDTNPRARRLYERNGFVAGETHSAPFLRRYFGFSASTEMIKEL